MSARSRSAERALSRRTALAKLGGLAAGALGASVLGARELLDADEADAAGNGPAAVASGLVTCILAPEQTQGPYYLDHAVVRRNVIDGKPGVPLTLRLTVVDASTCKPVKSATVEIWHCDAAGVYSGVQGDSGMFLRGVQRTDARGLALFRTIYPGWYPGRTVHIHTMVHIGGNVVHTGQLYFSDAVTDAVYIRSPYNRRPNRNPRNAGDSIYRNGGKRSTLRLVRKGSAYVGSITMGVQRT
ncbi:MAG TPA: intradiol ring-cleavage dioxygenase [Gaiellaceae bacterium]|nr:intradiol ring-cleavage dioxygenase [Gaiellaceae bacterium]